MKNSHILLVLILSAAIAFGVVKLTAQHSSDTPVQESAYDRVLRTGELRCGYAFWPKVFMKDPQTGEVIDLNTQNIGTLEITAVKDRTASGTFHGTTASKIGDVAEKH